MKYSRIINLKGILFFYIFTNFFILDIKAHTEYDSSKISGFIRKIVRQIQTDDFVYISTSDYHIIEPQDNKTISEFISRSKDFELYELLFHPDPIIRCYAFEGLYYKKYPQILKVIEDHLNDSALVKTQMGCGSSSDEVSFIMLDLLASNRIPLNTWLTEKDQVRLSIIIKENYTIRE